MHAGPFLLAFVVRLIMVSVLAQGLAGAANAAPPQVLAQAESGLGTAGIVAAILGYTAWPGAPRALTLCVSRDAAEAAAMLAQSEHLKLRWPLQTRAVEAGQPLPALCDAVYFEGWEPESQRQALRAMAGRPVLSLGRGAEFCSDGGLFCLEPGSGGLRFEVNLDAVARSGLRVHPQVLRLARPRAVGQS